MLIITTGLPASQGHLELPLFLQESSVFELAGTSPEKEEENA